jgi:hypothetical protein
MTHTFKIVVQGFKLLYKQNSHMPNCLITNNAFQPGGKTDKPQTQP